MHELVLINTDSNIHGDEIKFPKWYSFCPWIECISFFFFLPCRILFHFILRSVSACENHAHSKCRLPQVWCSYIRKANSIRMLDCSNSVRLGQLSSDLAATQNRNSPWPYDTDNTSTYLSPHLNHSVRVIYSGSSWPISRDSRPKFVSRPRVWEYMTWGQGSDSLVLRPMLELSRNKTQRSV